MTKEEIEYNHIKEIAEKYIQESWGSYLDLDEVDLVLAGIGVAKIISKEKDGRIEELEKENSRLILGNKLLSEKLISVTREKLDLQKENAELKSIADFQTSSNIDRYFQLKRSKEQLTKAKDIIRDYKIIVEGDHTTVCSVPEENRCINVLKLNEQAEQFLKECQNEGR